MTKSDLERWSKVWAVPALFALYLLFKGGSAWATPESGLKYEAWFNEAGAKYGLPVGLLSRVAYQESRYNPAAVSPAGAQGLMQFMPATAEEWGVHSFDAKSSIFGAAKYLRWLKDQVGTWELALAAYNFGIGNVKRGREWPLETVNYVRDISADVRLV